MAIAWLVMPIGVGILLGMLLAFVMQGLYGRLKLRLGVGWAAITVVIGTTLVWSFVTKGVALAHESLRDRDPPQAALAALT